MQGVAGSYSELQEAAGSCRELQGVAGSGKELQAVAGSCREKQGVAGSSNDLRCSNHAKQETCETTDFIVSLIPLSLTTSGGP